MAGLDAGLDAGPIEALQPGAVRPRRWRRTSALRDIVRETNSLMPAFGPDRLNDTDLTDVLTFMSSLRGLGERR